MIKIVSDKNDFQIFYKSEVSVYIKRKLLTTMLKITSLSVLYNVIKLNINFKNG